jgi:sugar fermentation stimulation protein A
VQVCQNTVQGVFRKRVNRFAAQVDIDANPCLVHVPNPARLSELLVPGAQVLLCKAGGPKTSYKLYGVVQGKTVVGIDSRFPNALFEQVIKDKSLPEFAGWTIQQKEYAFNDSRIDFLLDKEGKKRLVEVKSCSLVMDGVALFPDVPTERGLRHVRTLTDSVNHGFEPCVVWIVQRPDAEFLTPNVRVQPQLQDALKEGLAMGLRLYAYKARIDGLEMSIMGRIPVRVAV